MNKTLTTVVLIVLLAAFFQGRNSDTQQRLELYRQVEEGKVEMVGEVRDKSAINAYLDLYDTKIFDIDPHITQHPDVAVYLYDGSSLIHHVNVWYFADGSGFMQQIRGERKMAKLSEAEVQLLREILPHE